MTTRDPGAGGGEFTAGRAKGKGFALENSTKVKHKFWNGSKR